MRVKHNAENGIVSIPTESTSVLHYYMFLLLQNLWQAAMLAAAEQNNVVFFSSLVNLHVLCYCSNFFLLSLFSFFEFWMILVVVFKENFGLVKQTMSNLKV